MHPLLELERGTFRKKWKGRQPVALLYPNTYPLAVSNLGYQLVYKLLNSLDHIVCERFVYPQNHEAFRSLESERTLSDFPLVFGSVSFEQDFPRLCAMLVAGGVEPYADRRGNEVRAGSPLVVFGGVGVFMNPEPLAEFADIMVIGEAEAVLPALLKQLLQPGSRQEVLQKIGSTLAGCYIPGGYTFSYRDDGRVNSISVMAGLPERVRKVVQGHQEVAAHSEILSPEAELGMYMTELGRGCSRGCRFCAAGFIYRPPRLWKGDAVIAGLKERPAGIDRVGLLGMEMSESSTLDRIAVYLQENDCSLSFSSLRADRITDQLLTLLAKSKLKSVAIAPDGCSQRLRRVINKGLAEKDLIDAAVALVGAGIYTLKLYVMIGLPTETVQDLDELISLLHRIRAEILPLGQARGRVCEIVLSVNSFVPKPWTPFQYLSFGGQERERAENDLDCSGAVQSLRYKIKYLKKKLQKIDNLHVKVDRPDKVLSQAVFSRADRRIAPVLLDIGTGKRSFKQAMKAHDLRSWEYAVRPRAQDEIFCWQVVDHGIKEGHLYQELEKAVAAKATSPCDTTICRRCGVCDEDTTP
ncbi:MAG: radical SAM protein [Desulfobulbus sp.]|nr:MAG: radical SAM protein [Desulfobulbus sp.]